MAGLTLDESARVIKPIYLKSKPVVGVTFQVLENVFDPPSIFVFLSV